MKMHPSDHHPLPIHTAPRPDAPCHDPSRTGAEARSRAPRFRGPSRWFSRAAALGGVVAVLAGTVLLPVVCAAQEGVGSPENPTAAAADWSPEGRQLLVALLVLAGAFLALERCCAWRLAVSRRQTAPPSASTQTPSASPAAAGSALPTAF